MTSSNCICWWLINRWSPWTIMLSPILDRWEEMTLRRTSGTTLGGLTIIKWTCHDIHPPFVSHCLELGDVAYWSIIWHLLVSHSCHTVASPSVIISTIGGATSAGAMAHTVVRATPCYPPTKLTTHKHWWGGDLLLRISLSAVWRQKNLISRNSVSLDCTISLRLFSSSGILVIDCLSRNGGSLPEGFFKDHSQLSKWWEQTCFFPAWRSSSRKNVP